MGNSSQVRISSCPTTDSSAPDIATDRIDYAIRAERTICDLLNESADLRFVDVDSSTARLLGVNPRVLLNRRYTDFFDPSAFNELLNRCLTVFQSGQPQRFPVSSADFDGIKRTYCVYVDRHEHQIHLHCEDTTDTIAGSQLTLTDLLNTLPDALCLLEPTFSDSSEQRQITNFTFRFANRSFETVWSRIGTTLPGSLYLSSPIHSAQPALFTHLSAVVATGTAYEGELLVGNGTPTNWYATQISRTPAGSVVMTLHNSSAVRAVLTRAETQNQSLQEAIRNLERSNLDLAQFAQVASHDLQEPLRKIQVFSDLLQNQFADSLSEGERDLSKRLQVSAHRMQQMIRDLMNYSRLTSDKASFGPIDLNAVVADVRTDLDMLINDRKAVIDVAPLPTVTGNSSRLRQLFQNLIANALKFQPTGQRPHVRVSSQRIDRATLPTTLKLQPNRDYHLISVSDNGIGFDVEKYRAKLFRLFQRLHERKFYEGTGIGLAVAQRVAESHEGTVDVRSTPGHGSTFDVYLPA